MADNIAVTAGSGTTIAADVIGGVAYQRVKLTIGADNTAVDAGAGTGTVGTDTMRVTIASDDPVSSVLVALSKAEDAVHGSGDKGIMALSRRADTAASSAGTDGDYATINTDANGRLHVIDPGAAIVATAIFAEDAAHTTADKGIQVLSRRADTASSSAGTDGDYATLNTDANGRLHVIDPSTTTIAALSKAEDAAHVSGDTGIPVLTKRTDAPAVSSGTDGDYSTLNVDAAGKVWIADPKGQVTVTPTVTAGAYAAGQSLGGIQTIAAAALISGGQTILDGITILDKGNQKPVIDILFFNATPSNGTYTDNGAASLHVSDLALCVGRVAIAAADYQTIDSKAIADLPGLARIMTLAATSLFAVAVVRSGTPTPASTTDITIRYKFKKN